MSERTFTWLWVACLVVLILGVVAMLTGCGPSLPRTAPPFEPDTIPPRGYR